jgi:hypothetical protein
VQTWERPEDAFWAGFRDGYETNFLDYSCFADWRPVEKYHEAYELGLILGWAARNRKEPQL